MEETKKQEQTHTNAKAIFDLSKEQLGKTAYDILEDIMNGFREEHQDGDNTGKGNNKKRSRLLYISIFIFSLSIFCLFFPLFFHKFLNKESIQVITPIFGEISKLGLGLGVLLFIFHLIGAGKTQQDILKKRLEYGTTLVVNVKNEGEGENGKTPPLKDRKGIWSKSLAIEGKKYTCPKNRNFQEFNQIAFYNKQKIFAIAKIENIIETITEQKTQEIKKFWPSYEYQNQDKLYELKDFQLLNTPIIHEEGVFTRGWRYISNDKFEGAKTTTDLI